MYLITERTIDAYASDHPEIRAELARWVAMVRGARWTSGDHAVRTSLFHARAIPNKRLVFKLGGNDYRIVCSVNYADPERELGGMMRVQFIGTHAEYDDIDAESVEMRTRRTS